MVVGGGSPLFLQRRRVALQRWLTLVARHPVLAHDADLRIFLCETSPRLDKPKHDEFVLAGTQEDDPVSYLFLFNTCFLYYTFVYRFEQWHLAAHRVVRGSYPRFFLYSFKVMCILEVIRYQNVFIWMQLYVLMQLCIISYV